MPNLIRYVAVLLLLSAGSAVGFEITAGGCYTVDGPANVRDKPKGRVVASLDNGSTVRVVDADGGTWYRIDYSVATRGAKCDGDAARKSGWIHVNNLYPAGQPLMELVAAGRVMLGVVRNDFFADDHESGHVSFLGTEYATGCPGAGMSVDDCGMLLPRPVDIAVYCLDGGRQRNRVKGVKLEYGGDAGAYLGEVVYDKPLPAGKCVIVDGALARTSAPAVGQEVNVCGRCDEMREDLGAYPDFQCQVTKGRFDEGMREVAMVRFSHDGAPSIERADLFEMLDGSCRAVELGPVFSLSFP